VQWRASAIQWSSIGLAMGRSEHGGTRQADAPESVDVHMSKQEGTRA
jgi:hypothetical protein